MTTLSNMDMMSFTFKKKKGETKEEGITNDVMRYTIV